MIRVIENRKCRYVSIGYSVMKEHWDFKKQVPNKKHPNRMELEMIIQQRLKEMQLVRMESDLEENEVTSEALLQPIKARNKRVSFVEFGKNYCKELHDADRVKTAQIYRDAIVRLSKVVEIPDLTFKQITAPLLCSFEAKLLATGITENSVSVYMRSLRAIYNRGILMKVASENSYPFKTYKVSKLDNRTEKRAITKDQIKLIIGHETVAGTKLDFSKKVFLFSYYCRGINFKDIAMLTSTNLKGDRLNYKRAKTGQAFSIKLLVPAQNILNEMIAESAITGSKYLFPILSSFHETPVQINHRLKRVLKEVNHELKELAKTLNIDVLLTTYVARHSYATILKREGVSTSKISESLGHATEQITQTYLDSFENSVLDDADLLLL
jgi:site-specific recombinase XerD